jgi:hypothetical protein
MTDTTLTLEPLHNTEQEATTDVSVTASAKASGEGAGLRVPLFVPRSQMYYWTKDWQDGEAEALADIAAGRAHLFSSGAAAAEWLSRDED